MKCPKCHYLGFETGERCKNCGYDFSLLLVVGADDEPLTGDASPSTVDAFRRVGDEAHELPDLSLRPAPTPEAESPALPLFRDDDVDDAPLVALGTPRPPVAVRRTPDAQRARVTPPPSSAQLRASEQESVFEFLTEDAPAPEPEPEHYAYADAYADAGAAELPDPSWQLAAPVGAVLSGSPSGLPSGSPSRSSSGSLSSRAASTTREAQAPRGVPPALGDLRPRLVAALIDFGLLLAIDLVVVHFTLRVAALEWADLRVVPMAPLVTFLLGLKVAYLTTFTFAGGQTIGKMATGVQVVAHDDAPVTGWQALQRAVVELASLAAIGLPFVLALGDPNRRGLHDRLAGTRVVPSASAS